MPCYSPLSAYKPDEGGSLIFSERVGYIPITIACGQCIGCRLERSRQWAVRCVHESKLHEFSEFVTLTYDDAHIPVDHSLRYRDFQLFMKRLRKYLSARQRRLIGPDGKELRQDVVSFGGDERCAAKRVRFYMCGEYGENTTRPHYHACLFGIRFNDRVLFKRLDSGSNLYTSEALSALWSHGHCSTGDVTFESAAYVARYVLKKRFGDVANEFSAYRYVDDYGEVHYREPEFNHMSLKPGIGGEFFEKYVREMYPRDQVVLRGKKMRPPKYYDRLLMKRDAQMAEYLPYAREKAAERFLEDTTPERLRVREIVARAGVANSKKTLE